VGTKEEKKQESKKRKNITIGQQRVTNAWVKVAKKTVFKMTEKVCGP